MPLDYKTFSWQGERWKDFREARAAVSLAGGCALSADDTVEIHCNTMRAAKGARR